MRKHLSCLLLVAMLGTAAPMLASADTSAKPAEISQQISAAQPYGHSTYRWLGFRVYENTLWTDAKQWSMSAPFALSLHYYMNFTREELVERTLDELQRSHADSDAEKASIAALLRTVYADVKKGDSITALYTPGKGVAFFHNGTRTSAIADDTLAQRIMGIWLWESTSAPEARNRLLGLGDTAPTTPKQRVKR